MVTKYNGRAYIADGKSWDYAYSDEGKEYGNSGFMANS